MEMHVLCQSRKAFINNVAPNSAMSHTRHRQTRNVATRSTLQWKIRQRELTLERTAFVRFRKALVAQGNRVN